MNLGNTFLIVIFQQIIDYFAFVPKYSHYFLSGAWNTLLLSLLTIIFGFFGGLILGLLKLYGGRNLFGRLFKLLANIYVEVIRGTPLLIQIYVVYLGIQEIPMFLAGVIAMSLNSSAYVAEIIRAGINAVDRGQMEAARSLGMPVAMTYREIIIPQALKNILPALGNEFVVLIKESAVVSVIGVQELMFNQGIVASTLYKGMPPLWVAGFIYLVMTFSLSRVMRRFERKMTISD